MYKCRKQCIYLMTVAVIALLLTTLYGEWASATEKLGIGTPATTEEIANWNIDVRFDGTGLPPGTGDVEIGEALFESKCASCHGDFGQGEGRWPVLSGGFDSLLLQGSAGRPEKTVGSYWPYAPTLFDYIRRTMPYTAPQSLSDDETYALSAFVLYLNDIVGDDFVANAKSLAEIDMPNRANFIDDPRPDTHNTACMKNCLNAEELELLESIKGVTPTQHAAVAVENSPQEAATTLNQSPTTTNENGKRIYVRACAVCHATGVAQAPVAGPKDSEEWKNRISSIGMNGLVDSAVNGKGAMPPQKLSGLSAVEIKDAILHMLDLSGVQY